MSEVILDTIRTCIVIPNIHYLQGSLQTHKSAKGWRYLLHCTLQGILDMFMSGEPVEVSKVRRVFQEPLSSNSGRVGC